MRRGQLQLRAVFSFLLFLALECHACSSPIKKGKELEDDLSSSSSIPPVIKRLGFSVSRPQIKKTPPPLWKNDLEWLLSSHDQFIQCYVEFKAVTEQQTTTVTSIPAESLLELNQRKKCLVSLAKKLYPLSVMQRMNEVVKMYTDFTHHIHPSQLGPEFGKALFALIFRFSLYNRSVYNPEVLKAFEAFYPLLESKSFVKGKISYLYFSKQEELLKQHLNFPPDEDEGIEAVKIWIGTLEECCNLNLMDDEERIVTSLLKRSKDDFSYLNTYRGASDRLMLDSLFGRVLRKWSPVKAFSFYVLNFDKISSILNNPHSSFEALQRFSSAEDPKFILSINVEDKVVELFSRFLGRNPYFHEIDLYSSPLSVKSYIDLSLLKWARSMPENLRKRLMDVARIKITPLIQKNADHEGLMDSFLWPENQHNTCFYHQAKVFKECWGFSESKNSQFLQTFEALKVNCLNAEGETQGAYYGLFKSLHKALILLYLGQKDTGFDNAFHSTMKAAEDYFKDEKIAKNNVPSAMREMLPLYAAIFNQHKLKDAQKSVESMMTYYNFPTTSHSYLILLGDYPAARSYFNQLPKSHQRPDDNIFLAYKTDALDGINLFKKYILEIKTPFLPFYINQFCMKRLNVAVEPFSLSTLNEEEWQELFKDFYRDYEVRQGLHLLEQQMNQSIH